MIGNLRNLFALRRNGYSGPFFVGSLLSLMGLWFVLPLDTFGSSKAYGLMEEIALEEAWGFLMLGVGGFMVASALNRRPREVASSCILGAMVWFLLFASYTAGYLGSVVIPISLVMTFRCLSLYLEFTQDFDACRGERWERMTEEQKKLHDEHTHDRLSHGH